MTRRDNEDGRVWASTIGSDTIDLVDAPLRPTPPLKAPLVRDDRFAALSALRSRLPARKDSP